MLTCRRGGRYYRVAKPEWVDPLDLSFSKVHGGRWNPPGDFGALYLGGSEEVAAANARRQHRGRAIGLFDLRPERRPVLVTVEVPEGTVLDAVTPGGLHSLRLPASFPFGVGHERCQPIGRRAYRARMNGVASRSAAECTRENWLGEELAWFDRAPRIVQSAVTRQFADWYPDVVP